MSKSAKEMFEELGYKRCYDDYDEIYLVYRKKNGIEIIFDLEDRCIVKKCSLSHISINYTDLQAINKQVEQLGWTDGELIC